MACQFNTLSLYVIVSQAAPSGQSGATLVQGGHGGEFSELTELSHADLNGLVSEIEGEDEFFKFGNFELENIFEEFEEKVRFHPFCHKLLDTFLILTVQ